MKVIQGLSEEHRKLVAKAKELGVFDKLPKRELMVIEQRMGCFPEPPKTLKHIGSIMGISRTRVGQIQSKALRRLNIRCRKKEEANGQQ